MSFPFYIVGRHAVAEALQAQPERAQELLVAKGRRSAGLERLVERARRAGVKIRWVEPTRLEAMSGQAVHQGVALSLAGAAYARWDHLLQAAEAAGEGALVVVADHIQDPRNLGALIRTAAAAGAQGLVLPKDRASPLTPAAAKAAAGALARLPVARVTNLTRTLESLKEAGLWALAAVPHQAPAPWELDLAIPLALVVGGENRGVGRRLLGACDLRAAVPLAPGVESLNASVAAGMLLYEVVRQRTAGSGRDAG